jgi:hypothetical protein
MSVADRVGSLVSRAPDPTTLARLGLGATILLAGVHKLLAPWLVVSPVAFMLINGVLEVGFGAALLIDRWTAVAAAVAAVSLTATVAYLALVGLLDGGLFGDVLVRDVGLAALAWAVLVDALR